MIPNAVKISLNSKPVSHFFVTKILIAVYIQRYLFFKQDISSVINDEEFHLPQTEPILKQFRKISRESRE